MTTINELQRIVEYIRSLNSKDEKLEYLNQQPRNILNFLSKNIKKDGIAKTIASEIPNYNLTFSESTMESIILSFNEASKYSRKKDKIRIIQRINLRLENKKFVLTTLYGSLKLGVTIPIPEPEFGNTIKPQLCGTGIEFDLKKYIIEEKFDGIRCIATNNNGEITLQSRNGKVLNVPVIKNALDAAITPGTTVDGEIVASDGQFESLDRKSNNLIYMVFDVIFTEGIKVQMPLHHRLVILDHEIYCNDHVHISQTIKFKSMKEIDNWIIETGAEGIVAKNPNSTYQYGNRKDWIKYKHFIDCTCNVIDYTEGTGKRKGIMGAINVTPEGSSKVTKVGSGFTDDQLIEMKQLIDADKEIKVDVKFQNLTNDGALRFPTFLRIREINGEEI